MYCDSYQERTHSLNLNWSCWQEADEASSSPMDTEPPNPEVESEVAHVPETVRMMQMVDRDLEDLLLADDAWMMTW